MEEADMYFERFRSEEACKVLVCPEAWLFIFYF